MGLVPQAVQWSCQPFPPLSSAVPAGSSSALTLGLNAGIMLWHTNVPVNKLLATHRVFYFDSSRRQCCIMDYIL